MSGKFYRLGNKWVDWDEIHALGYTEKKPNICTFYDKQLHEHQVIQDQDTDDIDYNKYYDSVNKQWIGDITSLHLYKKLGPCTLYTGERAITNIIGYTNSVFSDTPTNPTL